MIKSKEMIDQLLDSDENIVNVFVIQISRSGIALIEVGSKQDYEPLADRFLAKLRDLFYPKREIEKPVNKLPI